MELGAALLAVFLLLRFNPNVGDTTLAVDDAGAGLFALRVELGFVSFDPVEVGMADPQQAPLGTRLFVPRTIAASRPAALTSLADVKMTVVLKDKPFNVRLVHALKVAKRFVLSAHYL
jgi:hypothetical protein